MSNRILYMEINKLHGCLWNTMMLKWNIWGNKYIKINYKNQNYKNWIDSNLLYVNDITDENGRVSQDYLIEKLKKQN